MTRGRAEPQGPSAVVWIDSLRAVIASTSRDGGIATQRVDRGAESETQFLARVVHGIGDRPTVSVIGPSAVRLALEREFVAISHRPDRLVGIPIPARVAGAEIASRIRRLAA